MPELVAFAHSKPGQTPVHWEPLQEHLEKVARLAGQFAAPFGAAEWGRLAGLWHDVGKYSAAFQRYLRASAGADHDEHRADVGGRVDHSTAGAQHAARLGPLGRLLAYAIAGHHAGLPDDIGGSGGLSERLRKQIPSYEGAPADLLDQSIPSPPPLAGSEDRGRMAFSVAFFVRMVFSCLVDADFLATEEFMQRERAAARPRGPVAMLRLLERLDGYLAAFQDRADDTPVNRRRSQVLSLSRAKADLPQGFFSLHVPTGGGKTLSSLAFALRHGARHGLRRVVYAIPFTSIIEQTANVFREALGPWAQELLEHHTNLDPGDPDKQSVRSRLAAENFDASIIVTTNVQLFESLFASRTSRCRKLHRLARSVIILDEAQALPANLLAPTLAALEELVRNYGTTVVLCTATQPAVVRRENFGVGLEGVTPIVDDPAELHLALRRTDVTAIGLLDDEKLVERLRRERQVLCIVNSRGHSSGVFRALNDPDALHLSANLCGAHRSEIVKEILARLATGDPCRVVCTQVIEAGVDVDFPVVYRAAAGLDSVAQAAGRCNREGRLSDAGGMPRLGKVFVFDYDERAHRAPPSVRRGAGHFHEIAPEYGDDLLAPEAVEAYFRLHYWQQGGDRGEGWDRGPGGRSVMRCFGSEDGDPLHHQFREAAARYQVIEDAQTPILVPFDKRGRDLLRSLARMPDAPGAGFDRDAQRYVVSVWDGVLRHLIRNGAVLERHGRYYLVNEAAYDPKLGIVTDVGWEAESLVL